MDIAAWLSGFVLFSLGVFHLSLWYIFRNALHGYLGSAWVFSITYIFLETKAESYPVSEFLPFIVSLVILFLFIMAIRHLRAGEGAIATFSILGYSLSFLTLAIAWRTQNFMLGTSGGAVFSSAVFIGLGLILFRMVKDDDFEVLVRGDDLLQTNSFDAQGPLVDRFVDELRAIAHRSSRVGKIIASVSFVLYGILQLLYPFKQSIKAAIPVGWPLLFIIAMILKLGTAVGFSVLLRASATLVEAKIRRGSLAEELSKITVSVEHDMRAPLREMGLIIKSLKQKYQHDSFVQKESRGLEQLVLRIRAVMNLILSIREGPDDYRKRADKTNLINAINKAANAAKALHLGREVSVKITVPPNAVYVYGYDERLTQALTNLINNALEARVQRYSDRMAVVEVRLRPNKDLDHVEIEIEDDGVGIDPKQLRYVKEAYYSTKFNLDNPNRGLGLYIADRIIGLHGGKISISSELGVGTVARVVLPWPKSIRKG